jgi:WD40 repeat protein
MSVKHVPVRRRGLASVIVLVLAACSAGGADPNDAESTGLRPLVGESAPSASVRQLAVEGRGRATSARLSDDGTLIVVTSTGVHRVEPAGGGIDEVIVFDPGNRPSLAAISPDGEQVALLANEPQSVEVYATDTGSPTRAWRVPPGVVVQDAWFEPLGGRVVVETSSGPVLIAADGEVSFDATTEPVPTGRLAALPDGTVIGAIQDSADLLVVGFSGEVERQPIELREGERLEDVSVAPDGGHIAVTASSGGDELERRIRLIMLDAALVPVGSIDTGVRPDSAIWTLTDSGPITADGTELTAWSIDGNELGRAVTTTPVIRLHASGDAAVIVGQDGSIDRWHGGASLVSIVAGGVTTVFESVGPGTGAITTIDLFGGVGVRSADGMLLRSEDAFAVGELTSLAVSTDGSEVAVGSTSGTVRVLGADLNPRRNVPAAAYGMQVDAVAFDPQTDELITGLAERVGDGAFDDTVTRWSADGTERFRVLGEVADVSGCSFFRARLGLDPTRTQLVAASHDFGAAVIDTTTGELLDELPGSATIIDLAYSPDGSVLAISHEDGVIDVWDAADRSLLVSYRPAQPGVSGIAILPGADTMLIADLTGALSSIDVMTGETVQVFDGAVERGSSLAVSPDGTVVAAAKPDGAIGFWSTASGAQVGVGTGHLRPASAMAFDPDGARLYSASDDGTVRSWSVPIDP